MSPLIERYQNTLRMSFGIVVVIQTALLAVCQELGYEDLLSYILTFVAPLVSVAGLFFLRLYDKKLWRIRHHRLDFSGRWFLVDMVFTQKNGSKDLKQNKKRTYGCIQIEQTATSIRIIDGIDYFTDEDEPAALWQSSACHLLENGSGLIAAIELARPVGPTSAPTATRAVDVLRIAKRKNGRPIEMFGEVFHCISRDDKRASMVRTHYYRSCPDDFPQDILRRIEERV